MQTLQGESRIARLECIDQFADASGLNVAVGLFVGADMSGGGIVGVVHWKVVSFESDESVAVGVGWRTIYGKKTTKSASTSWFCPSEMTVIVPYLSVRYTFAPTAESLSIVSCAGCPYGLPAPTEMTATSGFTASRNFALELFLLP